MSGHETNGPGKGRGSTCGPLKCEKSVVSFRKLKYVTRIASSAGVKCQEHV